MRRHRPTTYVRLAVANHGSQQTPAGTLHLVLEHAEALICSLLDDGDGPRQHRRPGGVACGAVGADLPLRARQHLDLPHLHHGEGELVEEVPLAARELVDEGPGAGVAEEVLVRGEEPLTVHQVHVVLVVERVGRAHVQRRPAVGALRRACPPELAGEGGVQRRVRAREQAVLERRAVAQPDGVPA